MEVSSKIDCKKNFSLPAEMAAQEQNRQEFFAHAERFRSTSDNKEAEKLGDELGRMIFGE